MNLHTPKPESEVASLKMIRCRLSQVCERLPFRSVYYAFGTANPPSAATITESPRLILGLGGNNKMVIPQGDRVLRIDIKSGDVLFVARNSWNHHLALKPHTFLTLDFANTHIRYYLRKIAPSYPDRELLACILTARSVNSVGHALLVAMEALMRRAEFPEHANLLIEALAHEAMNDFPKEGAAFELKDEQQRWRTITHYIGDHLHLDIDRASLADELGLHPNHISRLFRLKTNETFVQFLRRKRLERAEELLKQYDLSIKEIAFLCGFNSTTYFSSVFQKEFGQSPGQYRKGVER